MAKFEELKPGDWVWLNELSEARRYKLIAVNADVGGVFSDERGKHIFVKKGNSLALLGFVRAEPPAEKTSWWRFW